MKLYYFIQIVMSVIMMSCGLSHAQEPFTFVTNEQGIELRENGQQVYFYQKLPKSPNGKNIFNNYLHPLMSINGDTLTEEFPKDHLHHRGIFWAWHQIYVDNKPIADGWEMDNLETEVVNIETSTDNNLGRLSIEAVWKSKLFKDNKPFVEEHTSITVHQLANDMRKIDFKISLKALVASVEIGGSDDEKGYGGLSVRMKLLDDLIFTSANGPVKAQTLQLDAGGWMNFTASFGEKKETSGITIFCHPTTPNYPAPWILRSKTSMQNIVFPGRERVTIPTNEAIVLRYRLIVHNDTVDGINLDRLQSEYAKTR